MLLVTGYSQRAGQAAEFTVMRKPFHLAELSRTVERMIAQAKQPSGGNVVRLSDARSKTETGSLRRASFDSRAARGSG